MENWLSENRYQELRYFVLQYDDWKRLLELYSYGLKGKKITGSKICTNSMENYICERMILERNVSIIEETAAKCGLSLEEIVTGSIFDEKIREFYFKLSQVRE